MTGVPDPIQTTDEVTAVIEYRDGSVLDVVRRPVD
jgi:citrate lyase subunit alpha/citrate CoA-transferase